MRYVILAAAVLGVTACQQKADIDIPTARTRAALTLTAFECSQLAPSPADSSRLFNVGLDAGRDFLAFAEKNNSGYRSLAPTIDPDWTSSEARPSADFKLGELYAASRMRVDEMRGRWNDRDWQERRTSMYQQRNCAFIGVPAKK